MITKILPYGFGKSNNFTNLDKNSLQDKKNQNQILSVDNKYVSKLPYSGDNFVYFTASPKNKKSSDHSKEKLEDILYYSDTPTKKLISMIQQEALDSGYDKITTLHVIKHGLNEVNEYIEKLNNGDVDYNPESSPEIVNLLVENSTPVMFTDSVVRNELKPVIENNIKIIDEILDKNKPKNTSKQSDIVLSDDLIDSIWSTSKESEPIDEFIFLLGATSSPDSITKSFMSNLYLSINNVAMVNHTPTVKRTPFSEYEKKASNVLKNLSLGTNIFVTYATSKEVPQPFIDTIQKLAQNSDKKVKITELNSYAKADYFSHVVRSLAKDKAHEHIIIANPTMMILLDNDNDMTEGRFSVPPLLTDALYNQPSNVKFLFYGSKDNYYSLSSSPLGKLYSSFEEAAIPNLSTPQMVKSFKENPSLYAGISKPFSKKALEKTVEASAQLDGAFPEKSVSLMKKIVSYYIDKKDINERDVDGYLKEATNLLKKNSDNSSVEVIFDTGKRLKDLVGKNSTKQEALSIVKQIKSNNMGTKGIVIYSEDGSPGSGRRYTAKAIAGETHVPYIEINTMDFGTKEVDLFGGGSLSPEASIKKLFSIVSTQAEANPNKSAVLFIENFEYFSVGEMVSYYHQKAMAQLLREMDRANKAGLNILVVGSVSDPKLIGDATMKSFKFVDSVEVSSPAFNSDERIEILKRVISDNKVKLAGDKEEQKRIIASVSDFTDGFPFIYLKNLVKKAQSVAIERGKKEVSLHDFTEAFLQLTTGRPAIKHIEPHNKLIVTSHECGHATNLEVMNNIAKTIGKPWHIPDTVNFLTLDPRGKFGGAVYHGDDKNSQKSFENIFSMMVCAFGGNSAEEYFYGMAGSYGISSDMRAVRNDAELMVKVMGLGHKTGKMSISFFDNFSDKLKQDIEDDERLIINNAKIVSDLITEVYADFNREFTEKYASKVGSGECILSGDEFREFLKDWKSRQSAEKLKELDLCDKTILRIIDCTKKGISVRKES